MTLFVAVLTLDKDAIQHHNITDTYSLHRVVYGLFEDVRSDTQKKAHLTSGIQWRDQGGDRLGRKILMVANRKPDKTVLQGKGDLACKTLPVNYLKHKNYRFNVCINPTKRNNQSRKILPIKGKGAIYQWFLERAPNWGFEPVKKHLEIGPIQVLRIRKEKAQPPITLQQATITGYLKVTDQEHFSHSINQGIGRARGFGCGLLQVIPCTF